MYDLEYQGSSFVSEAGPWYQSGYWTSGVKTSTCDGNTIMGGYAVLGGTTKGGYWERQYTGIPTSHNIISLSIRIYPIDSWDYDEDDHFEIWFDGTKIVAWIFEGYDSPYAQTNLCGDPGYKDLKPMWMYATVPHTANTLTFRVINSLNEDASDESLGFRDITMDFQQINNPPSTYSFCGITQGNPLVYNACPCADGTYMYPPDSGNCVNCDSTCKTCTAGGSSACSTCPDGRYKVGNTCPACNSNCQTCFGAATTCLTCSTGWFMIGTTCYSTCDAPFYTEVVSGVTYCQTPCPGQYVWWDQSCRSSCTYTDAYGEVYTLQPVTINTFLQCNYPCATTGQYLFWNTSCLSTCPEPLTAITYKSRNFCSYPCADTTQYLYWNKSCLSTCPTPLLSEVQGNPIQRKFCWYPCQSSQFLLSDGSCANSCPSGYFENTALQDCQPCQDSLCAVCSTSLGAKCELCKGQNILNSNGACQGKV